MRMRVHYRGPKVQDMRKPYIEASLISASGSEVIWKQSPLHHLIPSPPPPPPY